MMWGNWLVLAILAGVLWFVFTLDPARPSMFDSWQFRRTLPENDDAAKRNDRGAIAIAIGVVVFLLGTLMKVLVR